MREAAVIAVLLIVMWAIVGQAASAADPTDISSTLQAIQNQLAWLKQEISEQRSRTTSLEQSLLQTSQANLEMLSDIRDRLSKVEVQAGGYGLLGGMIPALSVAIYFVLNNRKRNGNGSTRR